MEHHTVFSAVSTSVRQLYLLLRCISFANKAEVQITSTGIRFSVDEARVVQGLTFLDQSLFTSYNFSSPNDNTQLPRFGISLPALLEVLQIFGISETSSSARNPGGGFTSSYTNVFAAPSLALGGTCRISYAQPGSPLCITIQEGAVATTCEINTYDVGTENDDDGNIPLDRNSMCLKVIMRSTWLHDAVMELSGTNPDAVIISASERSLPYFAFEGEGGPFGDVTIEYLPESKNGPNMNVVRNKKQPLVTETFAIAAPAGMHGRLKQKYKFDLIKKAGRAMGLASKVSIRQDVQGVLSLQFMIEHSGSIEGVKDKNGADSNDGSGEKVYFVDFRFVPLLDGDDDDDEYESEDDEMGQEE
jgi:cell cycle checkpoint protein